MCPAPDSRERPPWEFLTATVVDRERSLEFSLFGRHSLSRENTGRGHRNLFATKNWKTSRNTSKILEGGLLRFSPHHDRAGSRNPDRAWNNFFLPENLNLSIKNIEKYWRTPVGIFSQIQPCWLSRERIPGLYGCNKQRSSVVRSEKPCFLSIERIPATGRKESLF